MRILGIDPGFDRLGVAVIEKTSSRPTLVWSTCVEPPKGSVEKRLFEVFTAIRLAIEMHAPDAVATETLFFSTNKKTALQVAEARGALLTAVGQSGLPLYEYTPNQVKLAVTGYGNADKAAVLKMVQQLIVLDAGMKKDDEIDAIAIALTCLASTSSR